MPRAHQLPGPAATFGMVLFAAAFLPGCATGSAHGTGSGRRSDGLRKELREHTRASQRRWRRIEERIRRLETELAASRRRGRVPGDPRSPARSGGEGSGGEVAGEPGGSQPAVGGPEPTRASCPGALPDAARRVRRRMSLSRLEKILAGVKVRRFNALTLTQAGSRVRQVWTGPCFRITVARGRVYRVDLFGVSPRPRARRRRRRHRR